MLCLLQRTILLELKVAVVCGAQMALRFFLPPPLQEATWLEVWVGLGVGAQRCWGLTLGDPGVGAQRCWGPDLV